MKQLEKPSDCKELTLTDANLAVLQVMSDLETNTTGPYWYGKVAKYFPDGHPLVSNAYWSIPIHLGKLRRKGLVESYSSGVWKLSDEGRNLMGLSTTTGS